VTNQVQLPENKNSLSELIPALLKEISLLFTFVFLQSCLFCSLNPNLHETASFGID
jgi:hypothetical protein